MNTYSGGKFVEDLSVGWRWFRRGCYSEMYKKRRSGGEYSGRKFVEDLSEMYEVGNTLASGRLFGEI